VGTHEVLYSDMQKFHKKLIDNDVDVELNIGEGMNHVYPVYPLVPESKEAFNHIVDVILNQD
jgi:acetyl esterase/lipase